ncbi:MAG: response regulator transcription factor [Clostridia bacterium]|nr:response regulator transcription factor [Clostridia bacterium]
MAIRLLLADDDALIREGLNIILGMDPDFQIIACAENGRQAVDACLGHPEIDVALVDIRMPVMDGVAATKEICERTKTKVLILTTFDDDSHIRDAIQSGAKGYLLKNNTPDKIKAAVKLVHQGGSVMENVVLEKLKDNLSGSSQPSAKKSIDTSLFSERELEIMRLISEGLSNREIASTLFISEGTVKNHITSILDKTGLEHRTQVAIYYINGGTLRP